MTAVVLIRCDGPCASDVTNARRLDVSVYIQGGVLLPNALNRNLHYCDRCFEPVARALGLSIERWRDDVPAASSSSTVGPSKGAASSSSTAAPSSGAPSSGGGLVESLKVKT